MAISRPGRRSARSVAPALAASAEIVTASVGVEVGDLGAGGVGRQGDVDDVRVAQVEVGVVPGVVGRVGDRRGQPPGRAERAAAVRRLDPAEEVAPVGELGARRDRGRREDGRHARTLRSRLQPVDAIVRQSLDVVRRVACRM